VDQRKIATSNTSTTVKNNIAVAYLRVSTKKQLNEGVSIDYQKKYAKEFAENNDLSLKDEYIFEESKPASKINNKFDVEESIQRRPVLNKIIELAKAKKFNTLIVYSKDRLTRNVKELYVLKGMLKNFNNIDIRYSNPSESFITNTEESYIENLIEAVLASISELETNILSSRVKLGNEYCVKLGLWPGGKIPFGYYADKVEKKHNKKRPNSILKTIPYEKEIINEVFRYYTYYGYGYRKTAEIMNDRYPFKTWTKSSIESIIKNQVYTGRLVWGRRGGRRNPGRRSSDSFTVSDKNKDSTIIDDDLWKRTTELRDRKMLINDAKYYSSPFLLKGKLVCGKCDSIMNTKNYGDKKKSAYRCPTKTEKNKSELIVEKNSIESMFISELKDMLDVDGDDLWNLYEEKKFNRILEIKDSIKYYKDKIKDLDKKLLQINTALEENIDYSIKLELKQLITLIRNQSEQLENIVANKEIELSNFYTTKEDFTNAFNRFFTNFDKLETHNRRMLIDYLVDKIFVYDKEEKLSLKIVIDPMNMLTP